jgi:hypothetical protein
MGLLDLIKQFGQANYNCGFFEHSEELHKKYDSKRLEIFNQIVSQLESQVRGQIANRKLIAHIKNNIITLQEADYIEDGNLIKVDGNKIELYEIPYAGGDEIFIGKFNTIIEAIAKGDTLT